ncbi:MAG: hypothetical protein U5L11_01650 [Arhodomonas sp.]|nr:hypothetical protein [Arhodomonas sp.]
MNDDEHTAPGASSGVEALLERLRDEGVEAGRERARRIVADAEHRATWMIEQAERDAEGMPQGGTARGRAPGALGPGSGADRRPRHHIADAGHTDPPLSRPPALAGARDPLRGVVAPRARPGARRPCREDTPLDAEGEVEFILPRDAVGLEELRRNPEELREGSLSHFVVAMARDVLREGVRFTAGDHEHGLRVRLTDHDMEIDITEAAVAELLLEHLQPRFRAMLEGIVK